MGLEDWAKQQQVQIANQQRESLARQQEQQRQNVLGRMGGHGDPSNAGFVAGSRARANSQANAAAFDKGVSQAISHLNQVSFGQPSNVATPTDHDRYVGRSVPIFTGGGGGGSYSRPYNYSRFSPGRYLHEENLGGAISASRNLKHSRGAKILGCFVALCVGLAVYAFSPIRHTQLDAGVLAFVLIVFGWFLPSIIGTLFAGTLTAVGHLIAYTARALVAVAAIGAVVGLGIVVVLGIKNQKRPAAAIQATPLAVTAPTSRSAHHKTKHHQQTSSVAGANKSGVSTTFSDWDSIASIKPRH